MSIMLKSLTIAPKRSYEKVGENNPYIGKIDVSYNDTHLQIPIPTALVIPILQLVEGILKQAASIAVEQFVTTAVAQTIAPAVEATAIEQSKEEKV